MTITETPEDGTQTQQNEAQQAFSGAGEEEETEEPEGALLTTTEKYVEHQKEQRGEGVV